MDHKTWLWRKKSSEKTIVATDILDISLKGNETEMLLTDKAELENDVKNLNDKLSSALAECNAKDDLMKKHAKMAHEAITGREKAEAEVVSLKQELYAALQQRVSGEESLIHLDAALKECMEQLHFVRDEQEQRIHDAVIKASMEFEKSQMIFEEKLAETSKRLAKLGVENTHLTKALLAKENLIEELSKQRIQAEADFNALMTRLNSTEKENASLKYEVRVLEKELEIRNEEREFNRRTADASHKQHLESVKKIAKLESECQRLRVLVRKRLPGPAAALAKMKNEVEILGRESTETRRKRLNSRPFDSMVDSAFDNSPDTPSKRINFVIEQLCALEEENKSLKDVLNKKTNELQFSRAMYARAASKLSEFESQIEELSKGLKIMEPSRTSVMSLSLASMSDIGSDDKVSFAESHSSALFSELEHLRSGKQRESPSCKTVGASDIGLMDDFVEMEKLAIVSVDKSYGGSHFSPIGATAIVGPLETESNGHSSEAIGKEIVRVPDHQSDFGVSNQEIKSRDILIGKFPSWLQDILELVMKQIHVTNRSPYEILEDVRNALVYIYHPSTHQLVDARESSNHLHISNSPRVSSVTDADISLSEKNQPFHSDLSKSIGKIAELIEGINLTSPDHVLLENLSKKDGSAISYKNTETSSGYIVRVFQWKTSELSGVLQQFVHACYDVLNKKGDFKKFAKDLSAALEWILNHCFSLQDVSSMRDAIKKHLDWDEAQSESEAEVGMICQFAEASRIHLPRGQSSCLPTVAVSNDHNFSQKEDLPSHVREEHRKLGNEFINVEAGKKVRQECLHSTIDKSDPLMNQLQESEKIISNLQNELEILKKSKEVFEDQVKNHKMVNEDLDTQLEVARVELNEARQKFSSLEVELEDRSNCYEELEATCLELQLQLESVTKSEIPTNELKQDEKQIRTDWEITAASEKLAECQETILNLGKQLKVLASPREAALLDKVIPTPIDTVSTAAATTTTTAISTPTTTLRKNKMINQRSSLLDRMMAEDNADGKDLNSPRTKGSDDNYSSVFFPSGAIEPLEKILVVNGTKHQGNDAIDSSSAIVPRRKKGGGSLWKKLIWTKKKVNSKKMTLAFAP